MAVILFVVGIWFLGVGLRWWGAAQNVVSPANVTEQHRMVIRDWEGLYSAANNACTIVANHSENSPTFVEDPASAYAGTFQRIRADYNRRMDNIFEAGIVGPPGYPREVPASLGADGDWCSVPVALDALMDYAE